MNTVVSVPVYSMYFSCAQLFLVELELISVFGFCFFFFKQKTAYEMLRSLVGSEMCIRDSMDGELRSAPGVGTRRRYRGRHEIVERADRLRVVAVSYTHLTLPTIYSV